MSIVCATALMHLPELVLTLNNSEFNGEYSNLISGAAREPK